MKKETKKWLEIAEEDFIDMKFMSQGRRYRGAVLFAQQAVEKILKAYIIEFKSVMPRKIHFIEELVKDADIDLSEIGNPKVKELSKAYTRVRYTDLSNQYYKTRKDTEELISMAEELYQWIKQKFKNN